MEKLMNCKIISLIIIVCLFTLHANAQQFKRKTLEEKAQKYTAEMVADIHLTPEQEALVYPINLEVSKRFDSLYSSKPEKDVQRSVTIQILKDRDKAFRQVLSNEQFLRFDDLQRERREKKLQEKMAKEKLIQAGKDTEK
jgi:hypothetical protein